VAAEIVDAFADEDLDLDDACVTLLVHAGIAAADVVCCRRLGKHAKRARTTMRRSRCSSRNATRRSRTSKPLTGDKADIEALAAHARGVSVELV
jgi:hypothetical protein